MRDLGECFDIANIAGGIADAFAENGASLLVDEAFDCVGAIVSREAGLDSLTSQIMSKQCVGRAIELRRSDDVAPTISNGQKGVV
jgi:hypothetical protein